MTARRLKPAIELLSDIGCKGFDLQHHSEADVALALEFMRTANGPMFDWLARILSAGLPEAREAGSAEAVPTVSDGGNKMEIDFFDIDTVREERERLRDHLHVAEQEVVKWKEQLDIRGRLWMEVAEANAKALHVAEQERDALKKERDKWKRRTERFRQGRMDSFASSARSALRRGFVQHELNTLRSALTQQIAEWREEAKYNDRESATESGLPYHTAVNRRRVYTKCADQLENLVEGRSQDGQP